MSAAPTQQSFTVERTIAAPRERVFAAWTRPEEIEQWFCPPAWSVEGVEMDVRVGGEWRLTMVEDTGARHPAVYRYREVAAPARLRFTTGAPEQDPDDPSVPVATVELTEADGGTQFRFEGFGPADEVEMIAAGWGMMFARLSERVEAS
jgi:uncharacterized protein YndB with AHSA1/START domain